mmetsp:Transcript_6629/g.10574  ORF Transcript_6629/g.10574 Transcript_6629/m.10574 type:complete len:84 (+) Transcript_6629:105-356(+)
MMHQMLLGAFPARTLLTPRLAHGLLPPVGVESARQSTTTPHSLLLYSNAPSIKLSHQKRNGVRDLHWKQRNLLQCTIETTEFN